VKIGLPTLSSRRHLRIGQERSRYQDRQAAAPSIDGRITRPSLWVSEQSAQPKAGPEGVLLDEDPGSLYKTRHRTTRRVGRIFTLTNAAYNLIRLPRLSA